MHPLASALRKSRFAGGGGGGGDRSRANGSAGKGISWQPDYGVQAGEFAYAVVVETIDRNVKNPDLMDTYNIKAKQNEMMTNNLITHEFKTFSPKKVCENNSTEKGLKCPAQKNPRFTLCKNCSFCHTCCGGYDGKVPMNCKRRPIGFKSSRDKTFCPKVSMLFEKPMEYALKLACGVDLSKEKSPTRHITGCPMELPIASSDDQATGQGWVKGEGDEHDKRYKFPWVSKATFYDKCAVILETSAELPTSSQKGYKLPPDFAPAYALMGANPAFVRQQMEGTGDTILHAAAVTGELEAARRLLKEHGADPLAQNAAGKTARELTNLAELRELLEVAEKFQTLVGDWAENGTKTLVSSELVCKESKALADLANSTINTHRLGPNYATVAGAHTPAGACTGYTLLHALCRAHHRAAELSQNVQFYEELVNRGADPKAEDSTGRKPMELASEGFKTALAAREEETRLEKKKRPASPMLFRSDSPEKRNSSSTAPPTNQAGDSLYVSSFPRNWDDYEIANFFGENNHNSIASINLNSEENRAFVTFASTVAKRLAMGMHGTKLWCPGRSQAVEVVVEAAGGGNAAGGGREGEEGGEGGGAKRQRTEGQGLDGMVFRE